MAAAKTHSKRRTPAVFASAFVVAAIAILVMFFAVSQAQGAGEENTSTLGVGTSQVSADSQLSAAERATSTSSDSSNLAVDETVDATVSAQRSITVKDPDPVVVPVAVDEKNETAVAKANEVCTLDPLPTAPHVAPDVNDGTWSVGTASGYINTPNDDGSFNLTASGRSLTATDITVAVPQSKSYLLGSIVEICYDGKVVVATVTDTGGFEKYGRVLDLNSGVCQAFGASSCEDWGLRTVYYRFL